MFEQAQNELRTLRDLLRFAVSRFSEGGLFFGHGADNAWDEAVYLLLHSLHLPLDRLEPFLDAGLTSDERTAVLRIIERRISERLPAAYLTNEAWLAEYRFYVDQRVIVPRSFIAELLREQLAPWIDDPESVASVLDLCTGSGCLAIFAAHAFPAARVDAIDISPDALAVAERNVNDYELTARIRLLESNLFAALDKERYDLIISNPPYVAQAELDTLPAEYHYEPRLGLAAGVAGLDVVVEILSEAADYLAPEGLLIVEVGNSQPAVERAWPGLPFTWLEFERGGGGVFLLTREQLVKARRKKKPRKTKK